MSKLLGKIVCPTCHYVEGDSEVFKGSLLKEADEPYSLVEFICPNCGARNQVSQSTEAEPLGSEAPLSEKEMRQTIITTLKRLYPTRTGYNGGHLALIRDPNPDLFFQILHQLETEGIIEYNDTQIAMRLSESFVKNSEVMV